jgi:hypothetical protein
MMRGKKERWWGLWRINLSQEQEERHEEHDVTA